MAQTLNDLWGHLREGGHYVAEKSGKAVDYAGRAVQHTVEEYKLNGFEKDCNKLEQAIDEVKCSLNTDKEKRLQNVKAEIIKLKKSVKSYSEKHPKEGVQDEAQTILNKLSALEARCSSN